MNGAWDKMRSTLVSCLRSSLHMSLRGPMQEGRGNLAARVHPSSRLLRQLPPPRNDNS